MATLITKGATTVSPLQVLGYQSTQTTGNILHSIIGRSDMDITFGPAGLRSGTLTFLFATLPESLFARDLHATAGILGLSDSDLPGIGMKYAASGTIALTLDEETSKYWTLAIDFQEVL